MRIFTLGLLLLASLYVHAQQNLSGSRKSSVYQYVWKINPKEALALFRSGIHKVDESYLHTLVDSMQADSRQTPALTAGNYLMVYAKENRLVYELKTIGDLHIKLINNNRDLVIALHTRDGKLISDAKVYAGKKSIPYDVNTHAFRLEKQKKSRNVYVHYQDVVYCFPLKEQYNYYRKQYGFLYKLSHQTPLKYALQIFKKKQESSRYDDYFYNSATYEKKFRGFMVFNKPIYKPGDTVCLKAFVMNKKGKGIDRKLLLRITERDFYTDSIIAVVAPYRNGGYEYRFVLSDSLGLDLDNDYLITLEEESSRKYNLDEYDGDLDEDEYALKRKILMRGKFRYEEYELESSKFTVRSSQKEHSCGEQLSIYAKATDENDLPVFDGRINVVIKASASGSNTFHAPHVFIPDTLWQHTQSLDNIGETKITLPDSIFPAASFSYQVKCTFLNTNNESQEQTLYQSFKNEQHKIQFEQKNDTLSVQYLVKGQQTTGTAVIYAFNRDNDTLLAQKVSLPVQLPVYPYAAFYQAKTDSASTSFNLSTSSGPVSVSTVRTRDSVMIQLVNPYNLPVWYTIFAGNKVIQRGYSDSLLYIGKVRTPKNYFVSLQYIYGDVVKSQNFTIPYRNKLLNVDVKQPQFIYPGQKSDITIAVTDGSGKPVADADVTAYAFTQKFTGATSATTPLIPYFGKYYPQRKQYNNSFIISPDRNFYYEGFLNWKRWSREMGLDSIEYYKFLHPQNICMNTEPANDGITQIAPFVVLKGEVQPVHLIYIDEKPVFFSQAQQLKRYSFNITEGRHNLRLRTRKCLIELDSVVIAKGMKTFLSVNADTSNKMVTMRQMPDTLNNYEKALWSKYLIIMENSFSMHMATLQQNDNLYLLNYNDRAKAYNSSSVVVGPLTDNYPAQLKVENGFTQDFTVESGYAFNISPGLIKQKCWRSRYLFNNHLSNGPAVYDFKDFVLTAAEVDSLWQDYLDSRCATEDLFRNPSLQSYDDNGRLLINCNKDKQGEEVFVKSSFLFRYNDPDFIRVYKGVTRDMGYLPQGNYRLFLLLKGDKYFVVDSIKIQKNGLNYYETGIVLPKAKDSISMRIAAIVNSRDKLLWQYGGDDLDSIKTAFNTQYPNATIYTRTIFGEVKDKDGRLIAGAAVSIKGTKLATTTDAKGAFRMTVPDRGTLVVAGVGYTSVEQRISEESFYSIVLIPSKTALDEVVVVGYGMQRKNNVSFAMTSVTSALQGKVAGITISHGAGAKIAIRGASSISSDTTPLIIIDGVPYSGSLASLDTSQIAGMSVLKDEAATALYGARAANGVIIITTQKAKEAANISPMEDAMATGSNLRRNFKDDAYWQPKLRTDKEGKTSFTVIFPDDITNWQTHVAVVAGHKQTGYTGGFIKSFKALSANLSLPQFAIESDTIHVIGKTLNYMPDSIQVKRAFSYNGNMEKEGMIGLRNSWIDTFAIKATDDDSLTFKYAIQKTDGYFDGEERKIPVFKQGVLETKGFFATLENDTSFSITTDSSLGVVKLYAESSVLPVLETEIENIRKYEYLCNEQLASKLKALLLQKRLCSYMEKKFEGDKNINEIITRLNQSRTQNLWGWWSNNNPLPWISTHVVEALLMAERDGYQINMNKQVVIDYLVYQLESYQSYERLFTLQLLHALGAKIDYNSKLDTLQKQMRIAPVRGYSGMYEQLKWLELKQKTGTKISLDTLLPKAKKTMFGNLYWGEENRSFFDNSVQITLLMYRLMKVAGGYEQELRKIRNYFLEKRSSGCWRNTYEASLILEAILPDLLMQGKTLQPASLTVTGTKTSTLQQFPFATQISGGEKITITKSGSQPVYFTAYQQQWNPAPKKVSGDITVTSFFEKSGRPISLLKGGEPVQLKVEVNVKANAEYVLVEIPIPAGCSYADKTQSYGGNEVHREYFKNKVSIFCSALRTGSYTFTVSLMPRYSGVYHLNPAKAELMYFPTFFGREEMKKVHVR